MAQTIGEQALRALQAAFEAITGVTGLNVERNRTEPVTKYPSLLLQDGPDSFDDAAMNIEIHRQAVAVEVYASGATQDAADEAADLLAGKVLQAIAAADTLGGLAVECRVLGLGPDIDRTDGKGRDKYIKSIGIDAQIEFWTKPGNPFAAGP